MDQEYIKLINEIEEIKEVHNFSAIQVCALHLAASFKTNKLDYNTLKEEFIKLNSSYKIENGKNN